MTAINVVLRKDKAILLTDAALYNADGTVIGFAQKAVAIPNIKAAIACRGMQRLTALLAMALSAEFDTFDAIFDRGEEFFETWFDGVFDQMRNGPHPEHADLDQFEMLACGWSDKAGRPRAFYFATTQEPRFCEFEEYVFGPLPTEAEFGNLATIGSAIEDNFAVGDFEGEIHGIPLMEAQRRMSIIPPSTDLAEGISLVGGHILLTEIDAEAVTQRVIHRWNDQPEMPIVADAFDPKVRWPGRYKAEKIAAKFARSQPRGKH